MKAVLTPAPLRGEINSIPSKSQAHRLLICAALAEGETTLACDSLSKDIEATVECLRALGADIKYENGIFRVKPIASPTEMPRLEVGESGSTLRFLLPVVCALGCGAEIKMRGRLPERPLSPLWEELERCGAKLSRPERDIIRVEGKLRERDFSIAADISSQYISGLLFALPILGGGRLSLEGHMESAPYVEMTLRALRAFGGEIEFENRSFTLSSKSLRSPGESVVEGDWSAAAFWVVAEAIGKKGLRCIGLDENSPQGDKAVVEAAKAISVGGAIVDARDIPDLVPVLAVLASVSPGETKFVNAGRLRIKESDRLATVSEMLGALGADIEELPDGLVLRGKKSLRGGRVHARGDHRIAMSAAVAAIACENEVIIENAECVSKSYPAFWRDYAALGGKVILED